MKKGAGKSILILLFLNIFLFSLVSAGTLQVTEEHPFLINGSWISAHDLKIGDILQTADGKKVRITAIEDIISKENFPVYNLEAGIYHDFVVNGGDNLEVIVHNSNKPDVFSDSLSGKGKVYSAIDDPSAKTLDLTDIANRLMLEEDFSKYPIPSPAPVQVSGLKAYGVRAEQFVESSIPPQIELDTTWVNGIRAGLASEPETLAIFDEFVRKFKVISEQQFNSDLRLALNRFLDEVPSESNNFVLILGRKPHSSPAYIFSKVKTDLKQSGKVNEGMYIWRKNMGAEIINPLTGIKYDGFQGYEFDSLLKSGRTKFVTLDDASYSGMELEGEFIVPFLNSISRLRSKGFKFSELPELHLVVPYITPSARASLEAIISTSGNAKIVLHTSDYVPPIASDLLTPTQIAYFNANPASSGARIFADKSAFVLEHKIADGQSIGRYTQLYKPSFRGYNPSFDRIDTVYKLPGTRLYELEEGFWDMAQNGNAISLFAFEAILGFRFIF